jgi:hypothetical protein
MMTDKTIETKRENYSIAKNGEGYKASYDKAKEKDLGKREFGRNSNSKTGNIAEGRSEVQSQIQRIWNESKSFRII